jgi:DNA-directed RNA polymerase specialized sigma24 family protein
MFRAVHCPCLLCSTEGRLRTELSLAEAGVQELLASSSNGLRKFPSVSSLLLHLRSSPVDARSDELLHELLGLRAIRPAYVEPVLILAFLPMLHRTARRVAQLQSGLSAEDISQQALSFLLEYLSSAELQTRNSHFAFAISRALKRKMFEWANRQGAREKSEDGENPAQDGRPVAAFERPAMLRHFLHRSVLQGRLSGEELDLIQFKMEGYGARDFAAFGRGSSNVLRQRLKRLLAKLRHFAREGQNLASPRPRDLADFGSLGKAKKAVAGRYPQTLAGRQAAVRGAAGSRSKHPVILPLFGDTFPGRPPE